MSIIDPKAAKIGGKQLTVGDPEQIKSLREAGMYEPDTHKYPYKATVRVDYTYTVIEDGHMEFEIIVRESMDDEDIIDRAEKEFNKNSEDGDEVVESKIINREEM